MFTCEANSALLAACHCSLQLLVCISLLPYAMTGGNDREHEGQWAEPAACLRNYYFFWAPRRCRRLGRMAHPAPMQPDSGLAAFYAKMYLIWYVHFTSEMKVFDIVGGVRVYMVVFEAHNYGQYHRN